MHNLGAFRHPFGTEVFAGPMAKKQGAGRLSAAKSSENSTVFKLLVTIMIEGEVVRLIRLKFVRSRVVVKTDRNRRSQADPGRKKRHSGRMCTGS